MNEWMDSYPSQKEIRHLQLLSGENKTDLIDLNPFLFLKRLLDSEHLIVRFKIEGLLAAC